ncbi:DUF5074 domain-containing protein [Bacteroides propionicifaciens]|uniref:DUF5074 domain-containing protein n=1 Tax=Bacteroides propionicifaciens TaxID=392838 RepID=UPI000371697A|nr:DUF5074 domain-containing protein [Bacteroides propionicifaciens]
MNKYILLSLVAIFGLLSCNDNDKVENPVEPNFTIENLSEKESVAIGESVVLKAIIDETIDSKDYEYVWKVNNKTIQDESVVNTEDLTFTFTPTQTGKYKITFELDYYNDKYATEVDITALGKFTNGVYLLDEGRMGEHGSLHFITSDNEFIDDPYYEVNKKYLGDVTQDLFVSNGQFYIISQNGSNDDQMEGLLTVANAETLERIVSFQSELSRLSMPTNIVVLNEQNIFIRDNRGVYRFNLDSKDLSYISGTAQSNKMRMTVVNGKVFATAGNNLLVLEADKNEVSQTIPFKEKVSSVIAAYDGNLWVSVGSNTIARVNAEDLSIMDSKQITLGSVSSKFAITPSISAYKEYIYYSGTNPKIYMFNYETEENILAANLNDHNSDDEVYQNVQVNPKTGDAYMTSLKSYSEYKLNHVTIFSFDNGKLKFKDAHKDHLSFPAGVFFTDSFN